MSVSSRLNREAPFTASEDESLLLLESFEGGTASGWVEGLSVTSSALFADEDADVALERILGLREQHRKALLSRLSSPSMKTAVIRKTPNKNEWCVYSHSGKNFGCFPSKKKAEERLRQVEYFKRKGLSTLSLYKELARLDGLEKSAGPRPYKLGDGTAIQVGDTVETPYGETAVIIELDGKKSDWRARLLYQDGREKDWYFHKGGNTLKKVSQRSPCILRNGSALQVGDIVESPDGGSFGVVVDLASSSSTEWEAAVKLPTGKVVAYRSPGVGADLYVIARTAQRQTEQKDEALPPLIVGEVVRVRTQFDDQDPGQELQVVRLDDDGYGYFKATFGYGYGLSRLKLSDVLKNCDRVTYGATQSAEALEDVF